MIICHIFYYLSRLRLGGQNEPSRHMRSFAQHFGDVVIDYLTLTFQKNEMFMSSLLKCSDEIEIFDHRFISTRERGFEYAFKIYSASDSSPIGVLKFNNPSHTWDNNIHIQYSNHIFYDCDKLKYALHIGDMLGLSFLCVARIDLALDLPFNIVSRIRQTMKSEHFVPVINNKCCWDRKDIIQNCFVVGNITRERVKINSLYVHNANKTLIVKSYNKLNEIREIRRNGDVNYKQYIIDYYGGKIKSLYRLEVSANGKYLYDFPISLTLENIHDQEFLRALYYELLGRVISFSTVGISKSGNCRSRKPISWSSLIGMPSNNNNITYYANIYARKVNNVMGVWDNTNDCCERLDKERSIGVKVEFVDPEQNSISNGLCRNVFGGREKLNNGEYRMTLIDRAFEEIPIPECSSKIKTTEKQRSYGFTDEWIDEIFKNL